MTYSVSILLRARQDVQQIFDWLADRSEQGAQSWFESFERSVSTPSARIPSSPRSPRKTTIANARSDTSFSGRDEAGPTELSSRQLRERCESFGSGDPESRRSAGKTWNNRRMPRKRGARNGTFVPVPGRLLSPTLACCKVGLDRPRWEGTAIRFRCAGFCPVCSARVSRPRRVIDRRSPDRALGILETYGPQRRRRSTADGRQTPPVRRPGRCRDAATGR